MKHEIDEVFEHWRSIMGHVRARMDSKRETAIRSRLKDGYTVEDLKLAIDGCAASAWHMGSNERETRYDSITLILRDADHVDRFIHIGEMAHKVALERIARQEQQQHTAQVTAMPVTEEQKIKVRQMLAGAGVRLKKVL